MSSVPRFFDRAMETSTTTGTGTYTLAGAVTGYQSLACIADGKSAYYCAMEVNADGNPSGGWEVGIGTYTASGTTLSRDSILASTNSNAAVSWAAGTRRIFVTVPASVTAAPVVSPVAGISLVGAKFVRVQGANLATGDNDLYTCPTGKRAYIASASAYNGSGGSIPRYYQVKISGTYYRVSAATTVSNGGVNTNTIGIVLDAGEIISINTTTTNGLNCTLEVWEFDDSSPFKSVKKTSWSTGDNTIYTCPAGKSAWLGPVSSAFTMGVTPTARLSFMSDGGGTRTVIVHVVPSGQAVGTDYRITGAVAVTANNLGAVTFVTELGAGDFINVNVDTGAAGEFGWLNVIEI